MSDLLKKTADLAGAYLARNEIASRDIPRLLNEIHTALQHISATDQPMEVVAAIPETSLQCAENDQQPVGPQDRPETVAAEAFPAVPAISLDDAVTDEAVYCLVCGKACRTLKGHLDRIHKLDVEAYRLKFGLERGFPMVAPAYSEKRRELALASGLGDRTRRLSKEA